MATEIRVPTLGESVTEATVGKWLKKPGDSVAADEPLVELETDKVTVEVPAPASGVLAEIKAEQGATVAIGAVLGALRDGGAAAAPTSQPNAAQSHPDETRASDAEPPRFDVGRIEERHAAEPCGPQADGGAGPDPERPCRLRTACADPQGGCRGRGRGARRTRQA